MSIVSLKKKRRKKILQKPVISLYEHNPIHTNQPTNQYTKVYIHFLASILHYLTIYTYGVVGVAAFKRKHICIMRDELD